MTFSDGLDLIRWARKRQEGQTMAEYAVVLGVITLAVVDVFTALSGVSPAPSQTSPAAS